MSIILAEGIGSCCNFTYEYPRHNSFWLPIFLAQRLFNVPAWLYSLLVCGKVAFQQTLDVYADRYVTVTQANCVTHSPAR